LRRALNSRRRARRLRRQLVWTLLLLDSAGLDSAGRPRVRRRCQAEASHGDAAKLWRPNQKHLRAGRSGLRL